MAQIDWSKISVALWGKGEIADAFVERLQQRHPGLRVFDREEELRKKASEDDVLAHLEVADMDAVFKRQGTVEHAMIRCQSRHQMFNYDLERISSDRTAHHLLLNRMLDCVPALLMPPEPTPVHDEANDAAQDEDDKQTQAEPDEE